VEIHVGQLELGLCITRQLELGICITLLSGLTDFLFMYLAAENHLQRAHPAQ
jgi:hypothetical protein|tara:strand:- start:291 stop:446 length:156 start_codon:yes stop_codon:yes gene_type:complete